MMLQSEEPWFCAFQVIIQIYLYHRPYINTCNVHYLLTRNQQTLTMFAHSRVIQVNKYCLDLQWRMSPTLIKNQMTVFVNNKLTCALKMTTILLLDT